MIPASVSVVMPTYNGESFLEDALNSVFRQSVLPLELVAVDDASRDGTVPLLRRLTQNAPFSINVIQLPKNSGGPATPMNVGVKAARGEVIVFLDQDDLMRPDRIERHLKGFRREAVGLNFGWITRVGPGGEQEPGPYLVPPERVRALSSLPPEDGIWILDSSRVYEDALAVGNFIVASNVAIRKSLWERAAGFQESFRVCWDYDFLCRVTKLTRLAYLDACVAEYLVHDSNFHRTGFRCSDESLRILRKHFADPLWPIPRDAFSARLARAHFDYGYALSRSGRIGTASCAYVRALRYGARINECIVAAAKVPFHAVRNWLRLNRPEQSVGKKL